MKEGKGRGECSQGLRQEEYISRHGDLLNTSFVLADQFI